MSERFVTVRNGRSLPHGRHRRLPEIAGPTRAQRIRRRSWISSLSVFGIVCAMLGAILVALTAVSSQPPPDRMTLHAVSSGYATISRPYSVYTDQSYLLLSNGKYRGFARFDTRSIGAGRSVTSATLQVTIAQPIIDPPHFRVSVTSQPITVANGPLTATAVPTSASSVPDSGGLVWQLHLADPTVVDQGESTSLLIDYVGPAAQVRLVGSGPSRPTLSVSTTRTGHPTGPTSVIGETTAPPVSPSEPMDENLSVTSTGAPTTATTGSDDGLQRGPNAQSRTPWFDELERRAAAVTAPTGTPQGPPHVSEAQPAGSSSSSVTTNLASPNDSILGTPAIPEGQHAIGASTAAPSTPAPVDQTIPAASQTTTAAPEGSGATPISQQPPDAATSGGIPTTNGASSSSNTHTTPTTTTQVSAPPSGSAPTTTGPSTPPKAPSGPADNSPLPFALPSSSTHSKLVFAHYFPPYPISLDNRAPADDYYTRNYLSPSGESGKFAAIGGLLRDRPVPRDPLGGDWQLTDMETDVRNARSEGIDGFAVDILSASGANWDRVSLLLTAAERVDPTFKVMLQPDMTSSVGSLSPTALANLLAPLASESSAYRLSDGRLMVSPFKAEAKSVDWWKQFMSAMDSHGVTVALMPLFLDVGAMAQFAPISYGFGEWGMRDPASVLSRENLAAQAHSLGKKWMAPVAVQDVRPNQHVYNEAGNTETLRASWSRAIGDDADFALLTTWNDYSESTSFAPSTAHGWTFLDISAYYQSAFQTGTYPSIQGDALYLTHRIQDYQLKPTDQSELMSPWPGAGRTQPRNTVEILSFLTAPATVTVHVGGTTSTYQAPAGVSAKLFTLRPGIVSAAAVRGGTTISQVTSPYEVKSQVKVQDLQYYAASSRRPTPRQP